MPPDMREGERAYLQRHRRRTRMGERAPRASRWRAWQPPTSRRRRRLSCRSTRWRVCPSSGGSRDPAIAYWVASTRQLVSSDARRTAQTLRSSTGRVAEFGQGVGDPASKRLPSTHAKGCGNHLRPDRLARHARRGSNGRRGLPTRFHGQGQREPDYVGGQCLHCRHRTGPGVPRKPHPRGNRDHIHTIVGRRAEWSGLRSLDDEDRGYLGGSADRPRRTRSSSGVAGSSQPRPCGRRATRPSPRRQRRLGSRLLGTLRRGRTPERRGHDVPPEEWRGPILIARTEGR